MCDGYVEQYHYRGGVLAAGIGRDTYAMAEASAVLEGDDDRLTGSLDSLVDAVRGLTEALERASPG